MKKPFQQLESLTEFHRMFGLPGPKHPMISFLQIADMQFDPEALPEHMVMNFYKVAYKVNLHGKAKYGQNYYDFGEGGLVFTAPGQVFERPHSNTASGHFLLIHPDFLLAYPLAKTIKQYGFFSYEANEALHLSAEEKNTIMTVFRIIGEELQNRIDDFSQDVIISQIELLLNYSNRFYKRQFITRKKVNNDHLEKLENILNEYFNDDIAIRQGLPTVQYLAQQLNISASYLSDMLRTLTGQNAQQLIHHKLVEKAKEMLSSSSITVAEIAYQLGFEHPQSFTRLFKMKTNLSPQDFRKTFN